MLAKGPNGKQGLLESWEKMCLYGLKSVGLPWVPDGRRTDALVNEDHNEDQVSTYLR